MKNHKPAILIIVLFVIIPCIFFSLSIVSQTSKFSSKSWKTYKNTVFGYSFDYPPELSVSHCENFDCGEIIYYPNKDGSNTISEDNELGSLSLIGGRYCQYENEFVKVDDYRKASLQASCDLPGVRTVDTPPLSPTEEKVTKNPAGLSQYEFYLQGYQGYNPGPFYALFFKEPIKRLNINKDMSTYYGVYWESNRFKKLSPERLKLFNEIKNTFKFD